MITVPGSCGELAQGLLNDKEVLITCPVSLYSKAKVQLDVVPTTKEREQHFKAYKAVDLLLDGFFIKKDYRLMIDSNLPRGKGMASSSADIAAACFAMSKELGLLVDAQKISKIALAVEPTDGVFFGGVVAFDHIQGEICERLGTPPEIDIAVLDFGGQVDTVDFNKKNDLKQQKAKLQDAFKEAYELIKEGILLNNPVLIGKGATISAIANQSILPKIHLEKIILIGNKYNALGVAVAHSGTVAGVLFDKGQQKNIDCTLQEIAKVCPNIKHITTTKLISGGLYDGDTL